MKRKFNINKSAASKMLVTIIASILLVAIIAVVSVYYMTASQPPPSVVSNFKNGAYAVYNITEYRSGEAIVSSFNLTIGEVTYNGISCWTLTTIAENTSEYVEIKENIDKSDTRVIIGNITMKMYTDGVLVYEDSFDPEEASSTTTGSGTSQIDTNTIVGSEKITIAAGTFENCVKATFPSTTSGGEAQISTIWLSQSVPAFGMVKCDATVNGSLSSSIELISFGGYP